MSPIEERVRTILLDHEAINRVGNSRFDEATTEIIYLITNEKIAELEMIAEFSGEPETNQWEMWNIHEDGSWTLRVEAYVNQRIKELKNQRNKNE